VYTLLRAAGGVALRWYYRDVRIEGIARIPRGHPLLLVVNHPNALVDALLVGWVVPWRVLILAKATLFNNRAAAMLLRWLGVLPVRRASDERARGRVDPTRNRDTFIAVREALRRKKTVLIFPEGKSHDEPSLAPLKSGAARIALDARDSGVRGLVLVPIGLTFERKELPRTRVLVQVGEPLSVDEWGVSENRGAEAEMLTAEIDARLRVVTLNYPSANDAARTTHLASTIASLVVAGTTAATKRGFNVDAAIARRINDLSIRLASSDPLRARADRFTARLDEVAQTVSAHHVSVEDIGIPVDTRSALRFIAREGWILLLGGPVAVWGRLNHWLPFRAARLIALRSPEDASDPAMRTVLAGAVFLLIMYVAQWAIVAAVWGLLPAGLYLVSLPLAADINFWLSDRLSRVVSRGRAFFLFRRAPALHQHLMKELDDLRIELWDLDRDLGARAPVAKL
jgi:glycerol-3-phosphate O-acyltransferase / dihydroxyacetone phosphate acyltransferase